MTAGILSDKRVVVFDLDGTVYLGDQPIEGVPETIRQLRERGLSVFFVTNNSSSWKETYRERLTSMGIPATEDDLVLSTDSVISALTEAGVTDTYTLGTAAMCEALADHGIDPDAPDPTHVVVGFDTELTYDKIRRAALRLQDGATFVAAHPDVTCPTPSGPIPDCGSITALLETATGRTPDRVLGKPDPSMLAPVYERTGCDPADIVVVGDRLSTDIRLAHAADVTSVLVLSGETTEGALAAADPAARPDVTLSSAVGLRQELTA